MRSTVTLLLLLKKGKVWKVKNVKEGSNRKDVTPAVPYLRPLHHQCVIWFCLFKMNKP